jgi:predicted AlkP superfamily phosphohydrolase/phosphomutase
VIGLDAATPPVVEAMLEAGELPNLARLCASGSRGTLESTLHPLTPQAWTTMVTGVNAGRHGIWDFSERDESGYRLRIVNGSRRRAPALWDYLGAKGIRSGLVNIPFTAPAPTIDGFAVAGLDAAPRDDALTYPRELAETLRRRFGELDLDHSFPLDSSGRVDIGIVERAATQKVEMARWLSEQYDPQLLFVVFMSADHIHHLSWPDWEERGLRSRVADVYRVLDGAVGGLADDPDRNVLVVSDHGGGSLDGVVNLNAWLAREGFLEYASAGTMATGGEAARHAVFRVDRLRRRLPRRLRSFARRRAPKLRDRVHQLRDYSVIDWRRTRAFAYGTFGSIVVNLEGRERFGTVDPSEYDAVRADIAGRLESLTDPDGRPIVGAVYRREELFDGPELETMPDLIVEFDDYRWLGKGNMLSRSESPGTASRSRPARRSRTWEATGARASSRCRAPRRRRGVRSRRASPTSRRPRSTCSTRRSRTTSRGACSRRLCGPSCSTSGRRRTRPTSSSAWRATPPARSGRPRWKTA